MSFQDKLIEMRKTKGWSQEELGMRLDVSRQTVSKWEMGQTTPEMSKLIVMSELFQISMDELVKGQDTISSQQVVYISGRRDYEYKSKTMVGDLPLVHINVGRGMKKAKGIIAIGNIAVGIVSMGLLSVGVVSLGVIGVGILAMASLALGIFSVGGIALGVVGVGGVAIGYLAIGGAAQGIYAIGGSAMARDIALGGYAQAEIAIGKSAKGTVEFITENEYRDINVEAVKQAVEMYLPQTSQIIRNIFYSILSR